jgi:GGDEF domain-containing protein
MHSYEDESPLNYDYFDPLEPEVLKPLPVVGRVVEKIGPNGETVLFILGDVSGDGTINEADLGMLSALASDGPLGDYLRSQLSYAQLNACDVNGDGVIDHRDVALLWEALEDPLRQTIQIDPVTRFEVGTVFLEKTLLFQKAACRNQTPMSLLLIQVRGAERDPSLQSQAIQAMAKALRQYAGETALLGRLDHDTLAWLLQSSGTGQAMEQAETVRQIAQAICDGEDDAPIPFLFRVIVFTGWEALGPLQPADLNKLLEEAEAQAVQSGRNSIFHYNPSDPDVT